MSRSSSKSQAETKDASAKPAKKKTEQPKKLKLRLKKNDYVRGEFKKAGYEREFPREEALRRLNTTDKWEPA